MSSPGRARSAGGSIDAIEVTAGVADHEWTVVEIIDLLKSKRSTTNEYTVLTGWPTSSKIIIVVTSGDTPNPDSIGTGGSETGVNPRPSRGRVNLSIRTRQLTSAATERASPGRLVTGSFLFYRGRKG